jgi:hypothetical protein
MADARGGVYLAVSGSGVFHADAMGMMTKYDGAPSARNMIVAIPMLAQGYKGRAK